MFRSELLGMQYIILSTLTAFVVCLALGPVTIPLLQKLKFGQRIRDDGPQSHLSKVGTPTMGGIVMVIGILAACIIFCRGSWEYMLFSILITVGFGIIGFLDDLIKILKKRSLGLKAYQKIIGQLGLAIVAALFAYNHPDIGSKVFIPLFNVELDLGIMYIPIMVIFVVGIVNSVNLTDGLDGLAGGISLVVSASFAIILLYASNLSYGLGNVLKGVNLYNSSVFAAAVAGSCLGFLRFNTNPARLFMGDMGSMALGGALCAMCMVYGLQVIMMIMGFMFVLSSISVILQVGSYKLRQGKRVFKMAPLHHHYELKGVPEQKIVAIYIIITIALALLCFLMLN